MKNITMWGILGLLLAGAFPGQSFGQDKVFDWRPANDESVRLDPANYHTGRTYHPGSNGGNMHVDIRAEEPVAVFLVRGGEWTDALQHPAEIGRLQRLCLQQHVVETTYVCDLPPEPMTLVIEDERHSLDTAVFAGLGAVLDPHDRVQRAVGVGIATELTGRSPVTRHFVSPNDVHVQYYSWTCVENCIQPEFEWTPQIKEKYDLTSLVKVYGGFAPDHEDERVSIRVKSPVPMIVAVLPSQVANQLHVNPESLEPALANSSCQQRAVQSLQFQCTFSMADGPQSLLVVPESTARVPHKKAEIEMQAVKCVANCSLLQDQQ